jgi:hypothetical protein
MKQVSTVFIGAVAMLNSGAQQQLPGALSQEKTRREPHIKRFLRRPPMGMINEYQPSKKQ